MDVLLKVPNSERTESFHEQLKDLNDRFVRCSEEWRSAILLDQSPPDQEVVIQNGGNPEDKERRALLQKSNVGVMVKCALNETVPSGVERELQVALGCETNEIPWELLDHHAGRTVQNQERMIQNAVTTIPTDGAQSARSTVQNVVESSIAAFLNVSSPVQATGDLLIPKLTTTPTVGNVAVAADAAESSPAYSLVTISGSRLQTFIRYALLDELKLPSLSSDLSAALLTALSEKLDDEILNASNGLLGTGVLAAQPSNETDEATLQAYGNLLFKSVDGKYSVNASSVKMLCHTDQYSHMFTKRVSATADETAGDLWERRSGGLRVSDKIPAVAGMNAKAILAKGSGVRALAPRFGAGPSIQRDPYGMRKKGEVVLDILFFGGFSVVESGAYSYVKFKVAT